MWRHKTQQQCLLSICIKLFWEWQRAIQISSTTSSINPFQSIRSISTSRKPQVPTTSLLWLPLRWHLFHVWWYSSSYKSENFNSSTSNFFLGCHWQATGPQTWLSISWWLTFLSHWSYFWCQCSASTTKVSMSYSCCFHPRSYPLPTWRLSFSSQTSMLRSWPSSCTSPREDCWSSWSLCYSMFLLRCPMGMRWDGYAAFSHPFVWLMAFSSQLVAFF